MSLTSRQRNNLTKETSYFLRWLLEKIFNLVSLFYFKICPKRLPTLSMFYDKFFS